MEKPSLGLTLDAERSWMPATFAERGVAVPFTTPALGGARARRGPRGLEAVVPQPAGARGVYILAWPALGEYCTPTLHDTRLAELIAAGVTLVPPAIREVARAVALEGLAGRQARNAATAAASRKDRARLLMNVALLERLVTQMKGAPGTVADLELRARACLRGLGDMLGRPAAALIDDVSMLAGLYIDHRLAPQLDELEAVSCGSCTRLAEAILALTASLAGRTGAAWDASAVTGAAERCRAMAAEASAAALALLDDVPGLLGSWGTNRAAVNAAIARADWLLDGWQQIVLIGQLAQDGLQRAACLPELALLVPPIPREACGWPGDMGEDRARARARLQLATRAGSHGAATMFDVVARNETLRALAA